MKSSVLGRKMAIRHGPWNMVPYSAMIVAPTFLRPSLELFGKIILQIKQTRNNRYTYFDHREKDLLRKNFSVFKKIWIILENKFWRNKNKLQQTRKYFSKPPIGVKSFDLRSACYHKEMIWLCFCSFCILYCRLCFIKFVLELLKSGKLWSSTEKFYFKEFTTMSKSTF